MILFTLFSLMTQSSIAADFSHYPAATKAITCKSLDYSSYFQAERGKTNIQKTNPDVSHPNFAGHYLVLKNELMLETLWLIADCETGKFFKEKLSGDLEFKPDSFLAVLHDEKDKNKTELQTWTNNTWVEVDEAPVKAPETSTQTKESTNKQAPLSSPASHSAPSAKPVTPVSAGLSDYDTLYSRYPAPVSSDACAKPDFGSYFRAQQQKDNILSQKPDLTHANFAGSFVLVKTEYLFETLWLVMDCKTGRFFQTDLSGKANFKNNSELVVLTHSSKKARLHRWAGDEWVELVNPLSSDKKSVSNEIQGKEAEALFKSLPNPEHLSRLSFEHLECKGSVCSVEINGRKQPASDAVAPLLRKWGTWVDEKNALFRIDSGKCGIEKNPLCQIENGSSHP